MALQLLGLLAGLGPVAGSLPEVLGGGAGRVVGERSCVDGGARAVVRVGGPERSLDVRLRRADRPGQSWEVRHVRRGLAVSRGRRTLFAPGDPDAAAIVRAVVERAGATAAFREVHARLGPSARLFSLTEPEAGPTEVTWLLDRDRVPAAVLDGAGLGREWRAAAEVLDALHGFAVSGGAGPWGVGVTFTPDPQVRIGTSRWTRCPDDPAKRRRAAAVTGALGGDGAFVDAAVQLLDGLRDPRVPARIGRAADVLVTDDTARAVDLYLAVPPHVRGPGTRPEESRWPG